MNNIISKFAVGSDESVDQLFSLREQQLKDTYENLVELQELKKYIKEELDDRIVINDLNDISTQLIITFIENKPVGYIVMKNCYYQPKILADKKAIHIVSFFILSTYDNAETRKSLWQKCLSVTKSYSHWIELPQDDRSVAFLEKCDFKIIEQCEMKPFNIPSHIMVRLHVEP